MCHRWTIMERFAAPDVMACPSASSRTFHHTRRKIRQVLAEAEPHPYTRTRERPAPVLGPYGAIIDQILADDEHAPPKQRHTAMQVFRRLRDEHGYPGCYGQVHRRSSGDTGLNIKKPSSLWGISPANGSKPISVTSMSTSPRAEPGSLPGHHLGLLQCPLRPVLPFDRTEAILAGMVAAFEFFGCVAREVWWDNPKTVVTLILQGRDRQLHRATPRWPATTSSTRAFCMPARGNEKPDAESTVKAVQRRFATPVPCVANLEDLNTVFVCQRCITERTRTVQSLWGPFEIAARFAAERAAAVPLPAHRFDPCVIHPAVVVDRHQTVAYDTNRYSVPRPFAFQMVTVKGYVDQVVIVAQGSADCPARAVAGAAHDGA